MREEWVDSWKGIMIILIVLSHIVGVGGLYSAGFLRCAYEGVGNFLSFFHTFTFFAIAAVTWKRVDRLSIGWVISKFKRLMIPYFVFGSVSMIVFVCVGFVIVSQAKNTACGEMYSSYVIKNWWQPIVSILHAGGWPDHIGLKCNQVLWFLPCLFATLVSYSIIDRFIPGRGCQIALCFVYSYINHILNDVMNLRLLPFSYSLVPKMLIYMTLSRWLIPLKPMPFIAKYRGVSLVMVCLFVALTYVSWPIWTYGRDARGFEALLLFPLRVCIAFGRPFILILATACLAQIFSGKLLAKVGICSLGIMLMHKFIILVVQTYTPLLKALLANPYVAIAGTLMMLAVSVCIPMIITKFIRKKCPWMIGES